MTTGTQRAVGWKKEGRAKNDFYSTPTWAIEALLEREKFDERVWECASGDGAISKVLEAHGYQVRSSDIREDDDVYGEKSINFLLTADTAGGVITNPPFNLALEFILHALNCAPKVAILARLQFLEGSERYKRLFSVRPPKFVYVFSKRVSCKKHGVLDDKVGTMAFAWYVWEKDFFGETTIKWICD